MRRRLYALALPAAAAALAAIAWWWWLAWTPLLKLVATPPLLVLVATVWVVGVLQGVDRVLPLVPMLLVGVTAAAVLACAVLAAGTMPEVIPGGWTEWLAASGGASLLYLSGWLLGYGVSGRVRAPAGGAEGEQPAPSPPRPGRRREEVLPREGEALI